MGIIVPYYTILVLAIYAELYILLFYEPPFITGGRIPVFVQKDPDCPSPLKQFNVVVWYYGIVYYNILHNII